MKYLIFILTILLLCSVVIAGPNDPVKFGNLTHTTVTVGGSSGIVNASGTVSGTKLNISNGSNTANICLNGVCYTNLSSAGSGTFTNGSDISVGALNVSGRINATRIDFPQVDVSIANATSTWLSLIGTGDPMGTLPNRNLYLYNLLARNVIELSGMAKLIFGYTDTDKYIYYNTSTDEITWVVDSEAGYRFKTGNVNIEQNVTVNDTVNTKDLNITGVVNSRNKGVAGSNLVLYLSMDTITSTVVKDYSGLGNDFYANNNATANAGIFSDAMNFSLQNNSFINRSYISAVAWNKNYTFMTWMNYRNTTGQENIFSCDDSGTNRNGMHIINGDLYFGYYNGTYIGLKYSISNLQNQWIHVIGVIKNAVPYLYVNGISVGTSNSPAYLQTVSECRISSNININNVRELNGSIDEVIILNRSISALEAKSYYEKNMEYISKEAYPLKNDIASSVNTLRLNASNITYTPTINLNPSKNRCIFDNGTAIVINNNASGITCPT